MTPAEFKELTM
jgi:hypothetical protein